MNKKQQVEQEVRKTLGLLESAESLAPAPYFYTRVQARLEQKKRHPHLVGRILKPALLSFLVAINGGAAWWYLAPRTAAAGDRVMLVEILSSDLNLGNFSDNLLLLQ